MFVSLRQRAFLFFISFFFMGWFCSTVSAASPVHIVAAENVYGNLAEQLGGEYVDVVSILHHPNQDPHLFSADINTAKAVAAADVIIYNGIHYDPWMINLIAANARYDKSVIVIADIMHKKVGDNPHLWYDPDTLPVYAKQLVQVLIKRDSAHQAVYQRHLDQFMQRYQTLQQQILQMKKRYQGIPVIATEPVFGYMTEALGLDMRGTDFQHSVMNDVPPGAKEVKAFEEALQTHQVKVLLYNDQVSNPMTQRMQTLAKAMAIPVVGVSETQPLKQPDYIAWIGSELAALDKALTYERH